MSDVIRLDDRRTPQQNRQRPGINWNEVSAWMHVDFALKCIHWAVGMLDGERPPERGALEDAEALCRQAVEELETAVQFAQQRTEP